MTLADICARVEAELRGLLPGLDEAIYVEDAQGGPGKFLGYDWTRIGAIDPLTLMPLPSIDGRGRPVIAFAPGLLPADYVVKHERFHAIEDLAGRRGHRGFQQRLYELLGCAGTFAEHDRGTYGSDDAHEWWAETGARATDPLRPWPQNRPSLLGGRAPDYLEPAVLELYRSILVETIVDPAGFLLSFGITRPFADMSFPQFGFHTGLDIGLTEGALVPAVRAGIVEIDDDDGYYDANRPATWSGISVWIRCDDGELWGYCHLSSNSVSKGQRIEAGTVIGKAGSTGASTAAHLHLERRAPNGVAIDPYEEVLMLSQDAQDAIRGIVKDELAASERRVLEGVKDYTPLIHVARRVIRSLLGGQGERRDPGTIYPDDTQPIT